jgi:hypothetical protein
MTVPDAPAPPPPSAVLPALEQFQRGDFRAATATLEALLATRPEPEVETAARALLARMAPDPWALRFGLLALALLAIVATVFR